MAHRPVRGRPATTWAGNRVSTHASVYVSRPPGGAALRDAYAEAVRSLTFGALQLRNDAIVLGPWTLLRFGTPSVTGDSVDWPIEGGMLAREGGGHWTIREEGRRVEATVTDFAPRLPRPLYSLSHLQVHELFTRLYLLRVRGRDPAPGARAGSDDRFRAATVDAALCVTLAALAGRRRPGRTVAIAAAYHVACWSLGGRTLGGLVMRQRVVAVDGSPLTPQQALLRLALLPVSWLARRPVHDDIAATDVITD